MKRETRNSLLVIGIFTMIPYLPLLLGWSRFAGGDALNMFIPWLTFLSREVHAGRFPLWDPYTFSGTPFISNIQISALYPFTWLSFFCSINRFLAFYYAFHTFFSAVAMYLWIQRRTGSSLAGCVSGLAWAWSGTMISHVMGGHLGPCSAYGYLPLMLLLFDLWRQERNLVFGLLLSIAFALQILTGHPQFCLYSAYFVAMYMAWCCFRECSGSARLRETGIGIVFLLLGGVMTSVVLIPSVEIAAFSALREGGASYEFVTHDSLPFAHLVTFIVPFLFGNPIDETFWETTIGYQEICGYMGILPLLLASFAAVKRPERRFFVISAIISLLFAFGSNTPLFRLVYYFAPGFQWFRVPARLIMIYTFSISVLAGLGVADLITERSIRMPKPTWFVASLLLVFLLGLACLLWPFGARTEDRLTQWQIDQQLATQQQPTPVDDYTSLERRSRALALERLDVMRSEVGKALLLAFLSLGWVVAARRFSTSPGEGKVPIRGVMIFGLLLLAADLGGFNFGLIKRTTPEEYQESAYPKSPIIDFLKGDKEVFRILVADDLLDYRRRLKHPEFIPERLTVYGIQSVRGYNPTILTHYAAYINVMQGFPPDRNVGGMLFLPSPAGMRRPMLDELNTKYIVTYQTLPDSFQVVFEDQDLKVYLNPSAFPRAYILRDNRRADEPVEIVEYSCNRVRLSMNPTKAGTLVLADTWYPGWTATVDEKNVDVTPYRAIYRSIPIEPGQREVTFAFKPKSFLWGAWISAIAWMFVFVLAFVSSRKIVGWVRLRLFG